MSEINLSSGQLYPFYQPIFEYLKENLRIEVRPRYRDDTDYQDYDVVLLLTNPETRQEEQISSTSFVCML